MDDEFYLFIYCININCHYYFVYITAITSISGLILFILYERQTANLHFGWAFFVGWTHVMLSIVVSIMMAMDTCQMLRYQVLA